MTPLQQYSCKRSGSNKLLLLSLILASGIVLEAGPRHANAANKTANAPPKNLTTLYQEDFQNGTYRITKPGYYQLGEDIAFGPQQQNDYWPPFGLWHRYPPTSYYLGFFAAITVEADDVTIDLGGHSIGQTEEFYLLQRFFNAIELNDRVFVQNNGVSSLNYQRTDQPIPTEPAPGTIVKPSNVVIKNGSLGRSSHSGIHGNGVIGLTVTDVQIRDFEVSGIHCNGCQDVVVEDCTIGPSSQVVPVRGTFSHARFLEFYTRMLIPYGFAKEPEEFREDLVGLLGGTISYSDRPDSNTTLQKVFDRLSVGMQLFRAYHLYQTEPPLGSDNATLLEEGKQLFTNPTGLPDGSVVYGVILNRLGLPTTDENFFGAGRETKNIKLRNLHIRGLRANPLEVAALMTEDNTILQGPVRDIIPIGDICTDATRSLGASYYKGNMLVDSYVAFWKLSNEFYNIRVFRSGCGNFGSNASFPMNLKLHPSHNVLTCAQLGNKTDETLSGRDVTMLQRRYFGGIQMTQKFYEWATASTRFGIDEVLASPPSADDLRSGGRHRLVCDHDTMFHPMHGVVGLKIVEASDVDVKELTIENLHNSADYKTWICSHRWQISQTGEDIMAVTKSAGPPQASSVRGIEVIRSNKVRLRDASVNTLTSDEGVVKGIEIIGDNNDRTNHEDDSGIKFRKVSIRSLSAAIEALPITSDATPLSTKGITYEDVEEIDSSLRNPRVVLNYQAVNTGPPIPVDPNTTDPIQLMMMTTDLDSIEKIRGFRQEVLEFLKSQYGICFEDDASDIYELWEFIPALTNDCQATDSFVTGISMIDSSSFQYHASSLCISDAYGMESNCTNATRAPIHDFSISFAVGPSGYTFHGAFGSDQGQFSPTGNFIASGIYSLEGLPVPGYDPPHNNVIVKYFGECPINSQQLYTQGIQGLYINCALESNLFGKGIATGTILFNAINPLTIIQPANIVIPRVSAYPTMVFDDFVPNPHPSSKRTNLLDGLKDYIGYNDIRFSFVVDGTFKAHLSGREALPYMVIYHYTHEAALEFLKRMTSFKTDDSILALRTEFLERLKDQFMISVIGDVSQYEDIPLDGEIDLGGGNRIVGYAVNEDANQRVLTRQGEPGQPTASMPPGSRLHEGGFRLVVGRSGLDTIDGRAAFGATIMQGIYVLENGNSDGSDAEISFHSKGIVELNSWSTSMVYQKLYHDEYGEGQLISAQPMPLVDADGMHLKISGALVFGNVE